jgi:hypothetical protein
MDLFVFHIAQHKGLMEGQHLKSDKPPTHRAHKLTAIEAAK